MPVFDSQNSPGNFPQNSKKPKFSDIKKKFDSVKKPEKSLPSPVSVAVSLPKITPIELCEERVEKLKTKKRYKASKPDKWTYVVIVQRKNGRIEAGCRALVLRSGDSLIETKLNTKNWVVYKKIFVNRDDAVGHCMNCHFSL